MVTNFNQQICISSNAEKNVTDNKLKIKIFYNDNSIYDSSDTTKFFLYSMYVNKNYTMQQIIIQFHKLLLSQKLAIAMCFGEDISNNIIKYLPDSNFYTLNKHYNTIDNYTYFHKKRFNNDNTMYCRRVRIGLDTKLIDHCNRHCQQDRNNINLYIRKIVNDFSCDHKRRNFEKIFSY